MDLYDRQVIQRRWLEAAKGNIRLIEEAVAQTNEAAKHSRQLATPDMVLEKIRELASVQESKLDNISREIREGCVPMGNRK